MATTRPPYALPLPLQFRAYLSFYRHQLTPWRGRLEERQEWLATVITEFRRLESHKKLTLSERATAGVLADRLDVMMAEFSAIVEAMK